MDIEKQIQSAQKSVKMTEEPAVATGKPRIYRPVHTPEPAIAARHIRILTKGWETFTGDIGQIHFENGVSKEAIAEVYVNRVAAQLHVVDAETGEQVGPVARMQGCKTLVAPVEVKTKVATEAQIAQMQNSDQTAPEMNDDGFILYSEAQLGEIVDKQGIDGLREIAIPLGVKGRSINDLIAAILRAQDVVSARKAGVRAPGAAEAAKPGLPVSPPAGV